MTFSKKTKGILSIIGASALYTNFGTLYTWASINPYFATYLRYNGNDNILPKHTFFLMPVIFFVQHWFMAIGIYLSDKYGIRFSVIISSILMFISYIMLIFFKKYYIVLISMGIFGLADAISNIAIIKNGWRYFPKYKGIIFGIISSCMSLNSSILTLLADYVIVNPKKESPDEQGIYSKEISDNFKKYIYILTIMIGVCGFLANILIFPYNEEENDLKLSPINDATSYDNCNEISEENKSETKTEMIESNEKIISTDNNEGDVENSNNNTDNIDNDKDYNVWEAFCSKKNMQLSVFCYCGLMPSYLIYNTNRHFGGLCKIDQNILFIMGASIGFVNGFSRYIWGYILDKFSFKLVMIIVSFMIFIISLSIYFVGLYQFKILYLIFNYLIASSIAGTFTSIAPVYARVFGVIKGPQIYGITCILIGFATITGPILASSTSKITDYLFVYPISSSVVIIQIIMVFIFNERTKYIPKEKKYEQIIKESESKNETNN